jgi:hypothetical protein
MPMEIRSLTEADAVAYRAVRLRALQEDTDAFGSSFAEEAARPLLHPVERFRAQAATDGFSLGAWDGRALVGIVTVVREPGE